MSKIKFYQRFVYGLLIIGLTLLSGCSPEYTRSTSPASDWSRGLLLGASDIKQPVALQIDAEGNAHLVWHETPDGDQEKFHYVRLDRQGQVTLDKLSSVPQPNPRRQQLLVDQMDRLHLAWLSRTGSTQKLYHTLIDQEGQLVEPTRISQEENVSDFQMYISGEGKISFIWSGKQEDAPPAIFQTALGADAPPVTLVDEGSDPAVLVDRAGTTHLTWLYDSGYSSRDVYYTTLREKERLSSLEGKKVSNFDYATSATYHGPVIGADDQHIYILWSIQNMGGGLRPNEAFAHYISFQKRDPTFTSPRILNLPTATRPDYEEYKSPYGISQLAPLPAEFYRSDFANAPSTVQHQASELPVTISLMVESASKSSMQTAMVILSEGEIRGYQMANRTTNASILSTLATDVDGNLHLAWLDAGGFNNYKVYYSTTAPKARDWLDRTTSSDVTEGAINLVWGILSGIGLSLIAMMWNVIPAVWLVVFYLFSREEQLDQLAAKISLVVAIVLYIASKLLFMPGLLAAGTPLLYQVPREMRQALFLAVPILILIVAIAMIYIYLRRTEEPSLFKAYVAFALTDGLLTAVLYAPRFFNPD
jgi:hypothetical protein